MKKVGLIAKVASSIREIEKEADLINDILRGDYLDDAGVNEFENIRKRLRQLMKYLPKEEYEAEYGEKPLGELVREIVGLDMNAAKSAFSDYLNDTNLDEI